MTGTPAAGPLGEHGRSHRPAPPDEPLILDCRGQRCPLPIIALARAIGRVPVGGVLRLLADDPGAAADVPAWCRIREQEFLGRVEVGGAPAYDIRRLS